MENSALVVYVCRFVSLLFGTTHSLILVYFLVEKAINDRHTVHVTKRHVPIFPINKRIKRLI